MVEPSMKSGFEIIKSILACPICKDGIIQRDASFWCEHCGISYPIVDGIPIFLDSTMKKSEVEEINWAEEKTYFAHKRAAKKGNHESIPVFSPSHKFAHSRARMALVQLLREISKVCKSKSVLDIGNGGNPIFPDVDPLIAIDLSFGAMRKLVSSATKGKQQDKPSVIAFTGKIQELPFKDNSFDITFCSGLLHHLGGQDKSEVIAINEMKRVTRSGGFILALEPNLLYPSGIMMNLVGTLSETVFTNRFGFVPHERALSPMKIISFLKKAGFSNIGIQGSTFTQNVIPLIIQHGIARSIDRLVKKTPFKFLSWWTVVYAKK